MAAKIEDYALIGDCESAALVDKNGSIDWLCWPDFSSQACFAALLGAEENGYWKITPANGKWKTTRRYRAHTLILETTFTHRDGSVRLIDFMPVRQRKSHVVRIVEGLSGKLDLRMELALRFDYGLTVPWVTRIRGGVRAIAGPNLAVLRASIPMHGENLKTVADFTVSKGERVSFSLSYGASHKPAPARIDAAQTLRFTEKRWRLWSRRLKYKGKYREAVERSLITLRALIYRPTGGVVASVTTSLPEIIGGVRNWDYRYCWLRDTTFTLLALVNAGYHNEAVAWQDWLLRALAGSPEQVQIMYGLSGERQLVEWGSAGSTDMKAPAPSASAMQLPRRCNSIYMGKCWTASSTPSTVCAVTPRIISASSHCCLSIWKQSGGSRIRAYGKRAEDPNSLRIRR